MKKFFSALVAVAAVTSSCGPTNQFPDTITVNQPPADPPPTDFTNTNTNTNTNINEPAKPLGSVSGTVLKTDLSPLVDVDVDVLVGGRTESFKTKTGADGSFRVAQVPGGAQALVTVSKPGFATVRLAATVPSSAGNVPIDDGNASFGPIMLAELNGTVRYMVTRPDGRPAAGARGTLRVTPVAQGLLSNYETLSSSSNHVTVEATANAQGQLLFGGVPSLGEASRMNATFSLYVAPLDSDNDGFPETSGYANADSAQTLFANGGVRFINLSSFAAMGAFSVDNATVASLRTAADFDPLRNVLRAGETIQLVFTHPVQPQSFVARLTNEYGDSSLPITAAFSAGNMIATLTLGASVSMSGEYNLDVRAVSAVSGANITRSGFFFLTAAMPSPTSIALLSYQETSASGPSSTVINSGEQVFVHFSAPLNATSGAQNVHAFLNADIGGPTPGVIGDAFGEVGFHTGFPLVNSEPTAPIATTVPPALPVLPLAMSGYSTRWSFYYAGSTVLSPSTLGVTVAFSKVAGPVFYETFLGTPVTADLSSTGVTVQPWPVP